jgi:hypothetical protein
LRRSYSLRNTIKTIMVRDRNAGEPPIHSKRDDLSRRKNAIGVN